MPRNRNFETRTAPRAQGTETDALKNKIKELEAELQKMKLIANERAKRDNETRKRAETAKAAVDAILKGIRS